MSKCLYYYSIKVNYLHDGDTITAYELDYGFGLKQEIKRGQGRRIRFYGINAPELSTDIGKATRDWLKEMLEGETVTVKSYKDKTGKYGGYLFEIFVPGKWLGENKKLINLNQWMVDEGWAKEFMV